MKKRILAILMLAALIISMFTACNKKPEPTAPADGIYTITLAHDLEGAPLEVLNKYLASFSETFPHIAVELVSADTENPNIIYCLPDRAAELAAEKKLLDLTFMVENDAMVNTADGSLSPVGIDEYGIEDFFEFYYKEGFVGDALYSMPLAKSSQILYFNQTVFEENELSAPCLWEDVEPLLVQLKEKDPDSIPLCIEDPADFFISMCAQNGGGYTSENGEIQFNSKTNRQYMEKLNSWYQKGYITTRTILNRASAGSMLAADPHHYMVIGSTKHANLQQTIENTESFDFELGIFPLPQVSYENEYTLARGPGLSIFKNDDDEVQYCAWMLVRFLTTDPVFQSEFSRAAGMLPVLVSAELEENYSDYLDHADGANNVAALAALYSMEQQHTLFTSPIFDGSGNVYDQVGLLLDKCLTLTGDNLSDQIEDAFKEAVKNCK